jgi:hypothetical protein
VATSHRSERAALDIERRFDSFVADDEQIHPSIDLASAPPEHVSSTELVRQSVPSVPRWSRNRTRSLMCDGTTVSYLKRFDRRSILFHRTVRMLNIEQRSFSFAQPRLHATYAKKNRSYFDCHVSAMTDLFSNSRHFFGTVCSLCRTRSIFVCISVQ